MTTFQNIPAPTYPLVDATGKINPIWYQFLVTLYNRSGGGTNVGNVQSIAVTSDNGITSVVNNEAGIVDITLGLGNITPNSVTAATSVSAATGNFSSEVVTQNLKFGIYSAASEVTTGFITITDSGGTPRRLLVG